MQQILPVADTPEVRRYARRLARTYPRDLWQALGLHVLAAISGLAAPPVPSISATICAGERGTRCRSGPTSRAS